jgi:hypothetical protein
VEFDFHLVAVLLLQACAKLNANMTMYPDLVGLEVSESDLLSRHADEQLSRVKTIDKEKAEVSITFD